MSAEHQAWIENLLSAEAWPHPVEALKLVETHISWVILTGKYAYKIKKPVDLGFVNFTELEMRKYYCEEELRLNRRFSEHLYLDVVTIRGSRLRPQIGGDGPILDYAVKMTQFNDKNLLSRLAARNQITPEHVDLLADEIAAFHRRAAVADSATPWISVAAAVQPAFDNFTAILKLQRELNDQGPLGLPRPGEPPQVMELPRLIQLRRWTESEVSRRRAVFEGRGARGMIRECHGDLHLGNMFLTPEGRIVIFDGIEFCEELRWIDIMCESAFTMMDLADRGFPGLAWRFLNRWLESTGDFEGLALLRFYLAYRAMVRAKVGIIRLQQANSEAGQNGSDQALMSSLVKEVSGYVGLAESYTVQGQPCLWITCGVSGSGKTFGSQSLVEQLGLIRLRSDVERKRLAGLEKGQSATAALSQGIYSSEATERVYLHLMNVAKQLLQDGHSVLIDATFLKRSQRLPFRKLAEELGIPFQILWFDADIQTLTNRIQKRAALGKDASDATVEVAEYQLREFENFDNEELKHVRPK
ncbi:MAG: AAA family ATPase [Planctomyces sp.]|nr:AAA family ATPase [Planctomyces sp.]